MSSIQTHAAPSQAKTRRMTINNVAEEDSPHVFIRNNASKITGVVSHVLLPYTSTQTGNQQSMEIPMTRIPIDLSDHVPKDELMRNPQLRDLWLGGTVDFIPYKTAIAELELDESIEEQDRLHTARQVRNRTTAADDPNSTQTKEQQDATNEANKPALPPAQPGQYDNSTTGVQGSVVAAMDDASLSDTHRLSMLRNLEPIMTDVDRRFVRGKTEDAAIRRLVGG